jgi:hypothetical protein
LKQLQLIQILCINALRSANAGVVTAKTGRVNPPQADAKSPKAVSGNADAGFRRCENGNRCMQRFTAR